jgi:hypothetical protein
LSWSWRSAREPYNDLFHALTYEGLLSANWLRVAAQLLDRFAPKQSVGYVSTPSVI